MPKSQKKIVEKHPDSWSVSYHYGMCGQSCPCCRSRVEEVPGFGTCLVCDQK